MKYLKKFNESNTDTDILSEIEDMLSDLKDDGFAFRVSKIEGNIVEVAIMNPAEKVEYDDEYLNDSSITFNTNNIKEYVDRIVDYLKTLDAKGTSFEIKQYGISWERYYEFPINKDVSHFVVEIILK